MSITIDQDTQEVRDVRPLRKMSESYVITIPPEILETAGLEEGDRVDVEAVGDRLRVTESDDMGGPRLRSSGSSTVVTVTFPAEEIGAGPGDSLETVASFTGGAVELRKQDESEEA